VAENERQPVPKPFLVSESKTDTSTPPELGPTAASSATQESVERRPRRKFSVADKMRIVNAAESALRSGERGALEALMRREGVYSSLLTKWRQLFAEAGPAGLVAGKPGRKPKLDAQNTQLQDAAKQIRKLERQLKVANLVIDLQKKAHAILGLALPEYDEANL
jgi:transposase